MATCPEVSIETILGSECIGDSLPKINGNFSALQTAVCDAITDITALQSAPAAPTTIISETPPVGTFSPGQMWFDSTSGITSIYYDSQWLDVGGGDSGTSAGSVNGIVKSDGSGNFSAAVAGTDYLTSASSGSVKAWVIVSTTSAAGGGIDMTIIDSYNVSSVTKVIGGIYQVNFTNSLNSATYAILALASSTSNGDISGIAPVLAPVTNYTQGGTQYGTTPTQNNFRFAAYYIGGSVAAYDRVSIMVF